MVKNYDVVAFGTGSALNAISSLVAYRPDVYVAVIERNLVWRHMLD